MRKRLTLKEQESLVLFLRKGNSVCLRRRGTIKELLMRGEHHSVTSLFIIFIKL